VIFECLHEKIVPVRHSLPSLKAWISDGWIEGADQKNYIFHALALVTPHPSILFATQKTQDERR